MPLTYRTFPTPLPSKKQKTRSVYAHFSGPIPANANPMGSVGFPAYGQYCAKVSWDFRIPWDIFVQNPMKYPIKSHGIRGRDYTKLDLNSTVLSNDQSPTYWKSTFRFARKNLSLQPHTFDIPMDNNRSALDHRPTFLPHHHSESSPLSIY